YSAYVVRNGSSQALQASWGNQGSPLISGGYTSFSLTYENSQSSLRAASSHWSRVNKSERYYRGFIRIPSPDRGTCVSAAAASRAGPPSLRPRGPRSAVDDT